LSQGRAEIAQSFERFRTDYIDVFQIHNLLDWETHLPTLEGLKAEGKIGLIGITHYQTESYPEMIRIMKSGRISAIQIPYNVLERKCEQEILPLAEELGIGVIVMQPLDVGRLVTGLKREPNLSPLRAHGIETWAQALLAWILADARVSVVIPATSKPERIRENAAVGALPTLPQALRTYIEKEVERCL
jgi:aryl-alcohol dehydrogenase-like predicted oxidoreductase